MSKFPYKSLTISGKYYSESELLAFAQNKISGEANPPWEVSLFNFILEWMSDIPILKLKTSGSTGPAKWIEIEKDKVIKSAELTGQYFNLQKDDKALLCLSVDFIAGKMMVVRAFVLGLNLVPIEPSGNPLNNIDKFFAFAAMTPMQVYNTLALKDGNLKLNQIKQLIIGGGDINQGLLNGIKNLTNSTFHTYGMTETLTHVAVKKLNGENPDSCFNALSGIRFSKNDKECLVISAAHLSEKKFVTNDIVDLKDEKSFQFIGRFDNVINSGGIKISPELVEQKLSPFIQDRFIIAGLQDEQLGEKVIIIFEGKKKPAIDFTKTDLTKYQIPKQVYYLEHFPETKNGKIIRKQVVQFALNYNLNI
jgi:o-succinylbenzoate---CoA ligase